MISIKAPEMIKEAKKISKIVHTLFAILPFEKKWFQDRGVKSVKSVIRVVLDFDETNCFDRWCSHAIRAKSPAFQMSGGLRSPQSW